MMKMLKVLPLVLGVAFCAGFGYAQPGSERIVVYSDSLLTECAWYTPGLGMHTFYVVHKFNPGATSSRFRIVLSEDFDAGATLIEETSPYTVTGTLEEGIWIEYGECLTGDALLASMTYLVTFPPGRCNYIKVEPHPAAASGRVEVTGCDGLTREVWGLEMFVSPWAGCVEWCAPPIPVEESTWGRIKALYDQGVP